MERPGQPDLYIPVHALRFVLMGAERGVTIGVDVGTSACKAIALAADGAVLHAAHATYPTRRTSEGEVSQRPDDWLGAVRSTLRSCASHLQGHEVTALGITAPAHAAVLADAGGQALGDSLLAFDSRPSRAADELRSRYGRELATRTFVELSAGWTLAQMAWRREHTDIPWARVRWLLTQKDWIRFRLTGTVLMDVTDAAGTAMVDQLTGQWLEDVCADIGFQPEQLPPIVPSTAEAGRLTREWARTTNLPAGLPVVAGATDTAAELVSVDALSVDSSLVKIASTGTVVAVSSQPVVDHRLLTYPHAVPGLWYTLAATNTATVAYQWLRETAFSSLGGRRNATYDEIDSLASRVPPGCDGLLFLPYLSGERTPLWDPHLRGAFLGLSVVHRRGHLARAVLEGVALSLRNCRDLLRQAGFAIEEPFLGGGGTSSLLWRRILVSVLGGPAILAVPHGPALGASILAASIGARTVEELRTSMPTLGRSRVEPVPEWTAAYDALDVTYRIAAEAIRDVSHRLSRTTNEPAGPGR
jgi:xylulokinase